MVADGRLRKTERLDQVTDAGLAARLRLDQAQEAEPGRVGDRLQRPRELGGLELVEPALEERRARSGDRRDGHFTGRYSQISILTAINTLDHGA